MARKPALIMAITLLWAACVIASRGHLPELSRRLESARFQPRVVDSCQGLTPACPPNYDYLGQGFDLLHGLRTGVHVLNLSLSSPQQASAYAIGTVTLPQQVLLGNLNSEFNGQSIYKNSEDYQIQFAASLGVSLPLNQLPAVLSASPGFQTISTTLKSSFVFNSYSSAELFDLTISSFDSSGQFITTPSFNNQLANLPPYYNSTSFQAYQNFLINFGTHIIWYLSYGAEISLQSSVSVCKVNSNGVYSFAGEIEAKFFETSGQISGAANLGSLEQQVYASSSFSSIGGSTSVQCSASSCLWSNLVASLDINNIAVVTMQLFEIQSVIADPIISANIKLAVADYYSSNATGDSETATCSASSLLSPWLWW